jgi:fructose/tagatose bisphosphate aldolase
MASRDQIIEAIMKVARHPSVGAIKVLAPEFADAILELDNASVRKSPVLAQVSKGATEQAEKETRVIGAVEQR